MTRLPNTVLMLSPSSDLLCLRTLEIGSQPAQNRINTENGDYNGLGKRAGQIKTIVFIDIANIGRLYYYGLNHRPAF